MAAQDEALDLKRRARRRLIGAIALVLFLMIVPPLVMDLEPKPVATTLNVEIPRQQGSQVEMPPALKTNPAAPIENSASVPAPIDKAAVPTEPADEQPPEVAKSATEAAGAEAQKRRDAESKRAEAILSQAAPAPTANQQTYMVPLASFSHKENVRQLQSKLSKAGIKSYTEPIKTASGEQTRVRAGPFASKDAAEKARAQLRTLGVEPGAVALR
jgi:DedD protein